MWHPKQQVCKDGAKSHNQRYVDLSIFVTYLPYVDDPSLPSSLVLTAILTVFSFPCRAGVLRDLLAIQAHRSGGQSFSLWGGWADEYQSNKLEDFLWLSPVACWTVLWNDNALGHVWVYPDQCFPSAPSLPPCLPLSFPPVFKGILLSPWLQSPFPLPLFDATCVPYSVIVL